MFKVLHRSLGLEFEGAISEQASWGRMHPFPISPWPGVGHFPEEMRSLLPTAAWDPVVGTARALSQGPDPGFAVAAAPPPLTATAAD